MLYKNALQYQDVRKLIVDLGSGVNVGVSFVSSNPSLLSVDALGLVRAEQDPSTSTSAWVYVNDAGGFLRSVVEFEIVPTSVSLQGLLDPMTGQPSFGTTTIVISDASEVPLLLSHSLVEGVASPVVFSGLISGVSYAIGTMLGGSLVSIALATAGGDGRASFEVTPDIGDSSLMLGLYRSLTSEEILSPVSLPVATNPVTSVTGTDIGEGMINVLWTLNPDQALAVTVSVLRSGSVVTVLTNETGTPAASGPGFTTSIDLSSVASGSLVVRVSSGGFTRDSLPFSFSNPNIVGAGWGLTAWGTGPWGQ